MFWKQECTLKPTWLPSVQGSPWFLMSKESTLPMLRLWTPKLQCFNKNCCRSSILKQDKTHRGMYFFKKKIKKEKKKKREKKERKRCTSAVTEDLIFFLCWTTTYGKVCHAVERDFSCECSSTGFYWAKHHQKRRMWIVCILKWCVRNSFFKNLCVFENPWKCWIG